MHFSTLSSPLLCAIIRTYCKLQLCKRFMKKFSFNSTWLLLETHLGLNENCTPGIELKSLISYISGVSSMDVPHTNHQPNHDAESLSAILARVGKYVEARTDEQPPAQPEPQTTPQPGPNIAKLS